MERISKLITFPADLVAEIEKYQKKITSRVLQVRFTSLFVKV
ncbi:MULTISPECIES: hypothetical protein [Bacillus cereus group]|nr:MULTISPECIES: hypothetical protein [Bacillus cereus group]